jgi:hypothetical protein
MFKVDTRGVVVRFFLKDRARLEIVRTDVITVWLKSHGDYTKDGNQSTPNGIERCAESLVFCYLFVLGDFYVSVYLVDLRNIVRMNIHGRLHKY